MSYKIWGNTGGVGVSGENLFDPEGDNLGYYAQGSGNYVNNSNYRYWRIPVEEGDVIYASSDGLGQGPMYNNGEYVGRLIGTSVSDTTVCYVVPEGVDEIASNYVARAWATAEVRFGYRLPIISPPENPDMTAPNLVYEQTDGMSLSYDGMIEMPMDPLREEVGLVRIEKNRSYLIFHTGTFFEMRYAFFEDEPFPGDQAYDAVTHSFADSFRLVTAPIDGYMVISVSLNAQAYCTAAPTTDIYIGEALLEKDEYVDSAEQKIYRLTDNLYEDAATSGTSYTTNGVTYTYDGIKWTAVGTATAYSERSIGSITLPAGTYYLWGIDSKAANPSNVRIRLMPIAVVCNGSNESVEFTLTEETTLTVRLVVGNGTDANGTEFEPFISTYSGYLHPEDPPTTLPQIPTSTGTTTISYDGTGAQKVLEKEVHVDTVTINGIEWDILGYDHDEVYKEDGTLAQHTVTIQTHECITDMQFDAREALFVFPDGLAAGSYTFIIKAHTWVLSDVGKNITFTLTQAIPKGGQLVVSQSYNASFTTGNISSYASSSATKPIETVKMNEGDTGTSLGDVTNAIVDNTNSCQRALLGSNRWGTSALKQLLNSEKAAGTFWKAQTVFDRPPSWAATTAGFLYGMDPDFVSVLGRVKKRTVLNIVSDGGGYEDSVEKVFLLSRSEVYAGKENNIDEGGPYDYFKDFSDFSAPSTGKDTNRIKYRNGAAKYWWLRSPVTGYANGVRYITPSGELHSSNATSSVGVAPACCVILDDIDSNSWLRNKFLKYIEAP